MSSRFVFRFIAGLGLTAGLLLPAGAATAGGNSTRSIIVTESYARATVPGQPSGGAYLTIENKGPQADTLKSISSPVAASTELHTMSMDGNVMKMREVGSVDFNPAEKIAMQPGNGYHIMLMGLTKPLKVGDNFPMTLTFAKAGKVEVNVEVVPLTSKGAAKASDHMSMH
jgi:copper(I)-binding protein